MGIGSIFTKVLHGGQPKGAHMASGKSAVKSGSGQSPAASHMAKPKPAPKRYVPTSESVILEGKTSHTVYIYYAKPLSSIKKGGEFYADVVTKPVKLVSPTGSVWDTTDDGLAFSYKGKVFGASASYAETFKKLESMGIHVKVKMKHMGKYDKYVPKIIMMLPDMNDVWDWIHLREFTNEKVSFQNAPQRKDLIEAIKEHKKLERAFGAVLPNYVDGFIINRDGFEPVDANPAGPSTGLWLMPVPDGSRAKPHIALNIDGKTMEELAAKNTEYEKAAKLVGCEVYRAFRREKQRDDGTKYHQLVMLFKVDR